jgi:hypothetical protein
MATRSAIGYITSNSTVRAVYAHWDGYVAHNGRILNEHYTDPSKVFALIEHGQISSLREEIGEQHPFSSFDVKMDADEYDALYGNMTVFYGRDRGEKDVAPTVHETAADFVEHYSGSGCEYYYLFNPTTGTWLVNAYEQTQTNGMLHWKNLDSEVVTEIARLKAQGYEV